MSSEFSMNLDVFKEPRGLIKVIQFLFSILAFSTTAGYNSEFDFNYSCKDGNSTGARKFIIGYPFWMETARIDTPCEKLTTPNPNALYYPYGSYTSSAQFFVFVGVMALLYTVAMTVVYVFFNEVYRNYDKVPMIDFIITAVWSAFWLIASIAWSVGVSALKLETYYVRLWQQVPECLETGIATCTVQRSFAYGSLNVSLICGYANVFLWGSSLWFLFKETSWWRSMHPEEAYAEQQQQQQPQQQQVIGGSADYEKGTGMA